MIAAAGIYALKNMIRRLQEDQDNARALVEGLAEIPGLWVEPSAVQTNFVIVELDSEKLCREVLVERLKGNGVLVVPWTKGRIRLVTRYGVERGYIEGALRVFRRVMRRCV